MKAKELEAELQRVRTFEAPKILLEQYPTRSHIAARILHAADNVFGDLDEDAHVVDLGAGCGVLAIGAALLGAGRVTAVDVDADAVDIARENVLELEVEDRVDFVVGDALQMERLKCDTVLTNPPFGTKHNKGADLAFLKAALSMASTAVYSLHKTTTRDYVLRKAKSFAACEAEVVAKLRYDLPASYKHHKKHSVDIDVDLFRFRLL